MQTDIREQQEWRDGGKLEAIPGVLQRGDEDMNRGHGYRDRGEQPVWSGDIKAGHTFLAIPATNRGDLPPPLESDWCCDCGTNRKCLKYSIYWMDFT